VTGKTYTESLSCPANGNNQLTTCSMGYDAAGNMTSNGTTSYVYDAENRLIATAGISYIYDGDGQRVEKCTERTDAQGHYLPGTCATGATGTLYWRGLSSDPLSETDLGGNVQNTYVFFNGQRVARRDSAGSIHYYFSDHLGSHGVVETVTTSGGTSCDQDIDYYPYGGVENDYCPNVAQNYKFTGKERDSESGVDNFGARYNASSLGRWMTPDAINLTDERIFNPANTLNKYIYGGNNPLKYIDPDGRDITVFYTDTGRAGHFWMVAYDQSTGQSAVADFGPQNGGSRLVQAEEGAGMDVPGDVNYQSHVSADEMRQDYTSLTIQTNPVDAQKAIQAINEFNGKAEQYNLYNLHGNENCTTICRDILKKILKLDSTSIRPVSLWGDIFKKWSNTALTQPAGSKPPTVQSNHGTDYGQPRYPMNTFDFIQLLLRPPQRACVTTYGPNGPDTTCN
jgi:RHS repeat-associated protein